MRVKPTIADIVLIAFLTLGSLTWLGFELFHREDGVVVEIYNEGGLYQRLDLRQAASVKVHGPLGDSIISVKDGQVRFIDSPCPDKLCVHMGAISKTGGTLICAPNRVSVRVVGQADGPDAVSY